MNSALGPVEKIMCSIMFFPVGRVSGLLIFLLLQGFVFLESSAEHREFSSTSTSCWRSSGSSPFMCDLTCGLSFLLDISGARRPLWGLCLVRVEQRGDTYELTASCWWGRHTMFQPLSSPRPGGSLRLEPALARRHQDHGRSHEGLLSPPRNHKPCAN